MVSPIAVGLGELVVSSNPEDIMVAYGLGSCLGIGAYDPVTHVAGLLHAVLPTCQANAEKLDPKYVDSGIEALLEAMESAGAHRKNIHLRMVGGANMLKDTGFTKAFDIGPKNIRSAHETIQRLRLYLKSQEVGGNTGRTVRLYIKNGRMTYRVIGGEEKEL